MRILREPLVHFLLLGVLVYVASSHNESTRFQIYAGPEQRARLARTYFEQYGVAPTPSQLGQALDEYVRNEILYREGLALGLERDDEIVRRRVVQKIEFVNEDLEAAVAPDPAGIDRYFADHRDRYDSEPTVSFEQIFFSSDRGGDAVARRRAEAGLVEVTELAGQRVQSADVRQGRDAWQAGDAFAEGREFRALTRAGANSLFGDTELSAALFTGPAGQWAGPFRSAYGWHVVRLTDRQPAHHAKLETVLARVQSDYLADLREHANAEAYRKIASKYRIISDGPRTQLAAQPAASESAAAALATAGPRA